ncbi:hypothetical protein V6N13_046994 [Hibiscus sabdariffa]
MSSETAKQVRRYSYLCAELSFGVELTSKQVRSKAINFQQDLDTPVASLVKINFDVGLKSLEHVVGLSVA